MLLHNLDFIVNSLIDYFTTVQQSDTGVAQKPLIIFALSIYDFLATIPYFNQILSMSPTAILCLKCLFTFILIVLIRITVPRFKLESLSKLG